MVVAAVESFAGGALRGDFLMAGEAALLHFAVAQLMALAAFLETFEM